MSKVNNILDETCIKVTVNNGEDVIFSEKLKYVLNNEKGYEKSKPSSNFNLISSLSNININKNKYSIAASKMTMKEICDEPWNYYGPIKKMFI